MKYKVGDKVKIISDKRKEYGMVGEIKAAREVPSGHNYIVYFPEDSNDFKDDELELIGVL